MPLFPPAAPPPAEGYITLSGTTHFRLPGVVVGGTTTASLTGNTIIYSPIYVISTIQVDAVTIEVTTLVSGNNARIGIYAADTNWQPQALKKDAGLIDTGSTGVKITSFTAITLTAGRYLIAYHSNNSSLAVRIFRGGSNLAGLHANLGSSPWINRLTKSTAFAAFADPGVAWDTITAGNSGGVDYFAQLRVSTP